TINEWQMIIKAFEQDNSLQIIDITSRKAVQCVREQIDTEKRCRAVSAKGDPIISTKFVFCPLIRSISNCIKQSSEITSLILEGLPLTVMYIQPIANAILRNSSLKMLSFARSNLMDDGCLIICSTIKHLSHIEKINFSHCDLTDLAAVYIGDLIKFQTINRYSRQWMKSLRYQDPIGNSDPVGLKCLVLNGNLELRDKGLRRIIKHLKHDEWIKVAIEFKNCGLTDVGGMSVIDCLKCNKGLAIFNVSCNPNISTKVFNEVQKILGAEIEIDRKETTLRNTIDSLEQRLEVEKINCENANKTNIELHNKLMEAEELKYKREAEVPHGYLLINEEVLHALYKQLEDLKGDRINLTNGQDNSVVNVEHLLSERSGCGDKINLKNIRIHQPMSRIFQVSRNY
ncbi:Protein Cep78 like, partial [Pseudolycoriella hygida]